MFKKVLFNKTLLYFEVITYVDSNFLTKRILMFLEIGFIIESTFIGGNNCERWSLLGNTSGIE